MEQPSTTDTFVAPRWRRPLAARCEIVARWQEVIRRAAACRASAVLLVLALGLPSRAETRGPEIELPDAVMGRTYRVSLPLVGAVGTLRCEVTEGQLPPGLRLQEHWIRGTPEQRGSFGFGVVARDGLGQAVRGRFLLQVILPPAAPLRIAAEPLPPCVACVPYAATIPAEGGYPPYGWELTAGNLPDGLVLKGGTVTGTIRRAPATRTDYAFTIVIRDSLEQRAQHEYTLALVPNDAIALRTPRIDSGGLPDLPAAVVRRPYRAFIPITGGYGDLRWSLAGDLPDGLRLDQGTLLGTPTRTGRWTFTVTAQDQLGQQAHVRFRFSVLPPSPPPPQIRTRELAPALLGQPYLTVLAAEGGLPPHRWGIVSGDLPTWAAVRANMICGTPDDAGDLSEHTFAVKLTDATGGEDGPLELVLRTRANPAFPPPTIASDTLPPGVVGSPYAATIAARDGLPPYSFHVTAGALPVGIDLAEDGRLSGTPAGPGEWRLEVRVTDSLQQTSPPATITFVAHRLGLHALCIGDCSPLTAVVGHEFVGQLPIAGGVLPYGCSIGGQLPPGLAFDPTAARFTGTPTQEGSWLFDVHVVDATPAATSLTKTLQLSVVGARSSPHRPWLVAGAVVLGALLVVTAVTLRARQYGRGIAGLLDAASRKRGRRRT